MHAAQQRAWLLEQIQSLTQLAQRELADRRTYAAGVTGGSTDAYVRTARAFGLVTNAEIVDLSRLVPSKGPIDGWACASKREAVCSPFDRMTPSSAVGRSPWWALEDLNL